MIPVRALPAILVGALLALLAACGGGDDGPQSVSEIDSVAEAVRTRNSQAILDMMQYEQVACTTDDTGFGGPPACLQGEEEGALVDVLQAGDCQTAYLRPDGVPNALQHFLNPGPETYAAYEVADSPGRYEIIFSYVQQGRILASRIVLLEGKIVFLDLGCTETPEEKIAGIDADAFIIEPSVSSPSPEPS
jgi:hypothetical protein